MEHWVDTVLMHALSEMANPPAHIKNSFGRIRKIIKDSTSYKFRTLSMERLADEITECCDLIKLNELLWQVTKETEFTDFLVSVVRQGSGAMFNHRVCTSVSEDWIENYITKSLQLHDPLLKMATSRDDEFIFNEQDDGDSYYWDEWRKHNSSKSGVCFIIDRLNGTRISVSFFSLKSKKDVEENLLLNGSDLKFISILASDSFCHISHSSQSDMGLLTKEELEFLRIISTSSQPENAVAILPNYGSNRSLQNSIRKKLRVTTIFQAISLVSSRGWLNSVPYSKYDFVRPYPELVSRELLEHKDLPAFTRG